MFFNNNSGMMIGKHIFKDNLEQDKESLDTDLIELYGGALHAIEAMTDEVLKNKSELGTLVRKNATILMEHTGTISAILICDNNSIEMRTKLIQSLEKFYSKIGQYFHKSPDKPEDPMVLKLYDEINIQDIAKLFIKAKDIMNLLRKKEKKLFNASAEKSHLFLPQNLIPYHFLQKYKLFDLH